MQLNRLIDITYTKHPEFGHRRIATWLDTYYGFHADRTTVLARMQDMGIQAVYPRQNTSKKQPGNLIYPYLLKGVSASFPDHIWSIDITYIPIEKSWLYLVAIIDWYSRYILAWEINDTLEISFVLDASKRALGNAHPIIMNSDQPVKHGKEFSNIWNTITTHGFIRAWVIEHQQACYPQGT